MAESAEAHHPTDIPPSNPTPEISVNPQALTSGFQNLHGIEDDHGAGLYAVPFYPFMGPMAGSSPTTLIPLKFRIPMNTSHAAGASFEQGGPEARPPLPHQQHQQGPQRQIVRRFQFHIHLDLSLILKLAAAIFLFNQEGSTERLILLFFFAMLVYLYQTGALAPIVRWIRQGALQPQPVIQPENPAPIENNGRNDQQPVENHGAGDRNENQNRLEGIDENRPEPERGNGFNWRGIAREIQTIIVGFLVSLIPGFHNNE